MFEGVNMAQRGRKPIDHTGQRFHRLLVLAPAPEQKPGEATLWLCRCTCDRLVSVRGSNLRSGNSKSCGYCGRVHVKPTEQEEAASVLTQSERRRQILDRIESLDDRAERVRVAAYPDFMANESVTTALTHLKAFLETAYSDWLWRDFDRSGRNCDRVVACLEQLETLIGERDDTQHHECAPEPAMVGAK